MRVVVHVGMPKTGSSTIQEVFSKIQSEDFQYVKWASANHSALFVLLFEDEEKLPNYHGFKAQGPEFIARLPALKKQWLSSLSSTLDEANGKTVLFSAEDISAGEFRNATQRMYEYFANWTEDINAVGYVRPPKSFCQSMFQQYLRGGTAARFIPGMVWPHYRARFQKIDEIFGRDRTSLRVYDRENLIGGNLLSDFASVIGFSPEYPVNDVHNKSLSLEAIALLYIQRRFGAGYVSGFHGAPAKNEEFISNLSRIGSQRMAFSDSMWKPIAESFKEDIAWIEERLGQRFSEGSEQSDAAINGEDDLIGIALASASELTGLLNDHSTPGPIDLPRLLGRVEELRVRSYGVA